MSPRRWTHLHRQLRLVDVNCGCNCILIIKANENISRCHVLLSLTLLLHWYEWGVPSPVQHGERHRLRGLPAVNPPAPPAHQERLLHQVSSVIFIHLWLLSNGVPVIIGFMSLNLVPNSWNEALANVTLNLFLITNDLLIVALLVYLRPTYISKLKPGWNVIVPKNNSFIDFGEPVLKCLYITLTVFLVIFLKVFPVQVEMFGCLISSLM